MKAPIRILSIGIHVFLTFSAYRICYVALRLSKDPSRGSSLCFRNLESHTGRICVVGLAPTHPALQKEIVKVNFDLGIKGPTKLSGKRKKEALHLRPEQPLCNITCSDGTQYLVRACIDGDLMELNEKLSNNIPLLKEKPMSDGYIAVVSMAFKKKNVEDFGGISASAYESARKLVRTEAGFNVVGAIPTVDSTDSSTTTTTTTTTTTAPVAVLEQSSTSS